MGPFLKIVRSSGRTVLGFGIALGATCYPAQGQDQLSQLFYLFHVPVYLGYNVGASTDFVTDYKEAMIIPSFATPSTISASATSSLSSASGSANFGNNTGVFNAQASASPPAIGSGIGSAAAAASFLIGVEDSITVIGPSSAPFTIELVAVVTGSQSGANGNVISYSVGQFYGGVCAKTGVTATVAKNWGCRETEGFGFPSGSLTVDGVAGDNILVAWAGGADASAHTQPGEGAVAAAAAATVTFVVRNLPPGFTLQSARGIVYSTAPPPPPPPPPPANCITSAAPQNQLLKPSPPYDNSPFRFSQKGCAVTSLAMALTSAGHPIDAYSLNSLMSKHGGFQTGSYNVNWLTTVGLINSLNPSKTLKFNDSEWNNQDLTSLDKGLCTEHSPVIVGVKLSYDDKGKLKPSHYVLVTGKRINSNGTVDYLVNDPEERAQTLADYDNKFLVRGWVKDPPGDFSQLSVNVDDAAEILITDASNRRVGFDSGSGLTLGEIPNSAYFRDSLGDDENSSAPPPAEGHLAEVFAPAAGSYQVSVIGMKPGLFSLDVKPFSQDSKPQSFKTLQGISFPGSRSSFEIEFVPAVGANSNVMRVATAESAEADIRNARSIGLIKDDGLSNALLNLIDNANRLSTRGLNDTAINILSAFENLIGAQTSKGIDEAAAKILIEDAEYLKGIYGGR